MRDGMIYPTGSPMADRRNIQRALDKAKRNPSGRMHEVRLASGHFYIDRCLVVYSNTHLILQKDTIIQRKDQYRILLKSDTDHVSGGYRHAKHIIIEGGIWDGNAVDTVKYRKLIKFSHAESITFKNARIQHVTGKHVMTFAGVKGVHVENVTFTDYIGLDLSERKRENAELLHIDGISTDGVSEPGETPYDETPCTDVHILNCVFDGGCCGIGSHYKPFQEIGHGFEVRGCQFRNLSYTAIDIFHFREVQIEKNTFENCNNFFRFYDTRGFWEGKNIELQKEFDKIN